MNNTFERQEMWYKIGIGAFFLALIIAAAIAVHLAWKDKAKKARNKAARKEVAEKEEIRVIATAIRPYVDLPSSMPEPFTHKLFFKVFVVNSIVKIVKYTALPEGGFADEEVFEVTVKPFPREFTINPRFAKNGDTVYPFIMLGSQVLGVVGENPAYLITAEDLFSKKK